MIHTEERNVRTLHPPPSHPPWLTAPTPFHLRGTPVTSQQTFPLVQYIGPATPEIGVTRGRAFTRTLLFSNISYDAIDLIGPLGLEGAIFLRRVSVACKAGVSTTGLSTFTNNTPKTHETNEVYIALGCYLEPKNHAEVLQQLRREHTGCAVYIISSPPIKGIPDPNLQYV